MPIRAALVHPRSSRLSRGAHGALAGGLAALALAACADGPPTAPGDAAPAPLARASLSAAVGAPVCHTEGFEEFTRGQFVTTVTPGPLTLAVGATAFRQGAASVAGQAQIFDTDFVSLGANDGTDMQWSGSFARCPGCEGLGNLLIVHRYGSASILDNNPGGTLALTGFPAGQYWVQSFTVVDNDRNELGVRLHVDGALVAQATPLGDGSVQLVTTGSAVPINVEVRFTLGTEAIDAALGSGGIDDITFCANPPGVGCTRTLGYWKTHSHRGPAPYDDAWLNIGPLGADTEFFDLGRTWYQVFWTAPRGNANYILAHQYMAAKLNILNGAATTPAVVAAITGAEAYFGALGSLSSAPTGATRATLLGWADTLDQYNNGVIGPGHCSG